MSTGTVRIECLAEGCSYRIALDTDFEYKDACLAIDELHDLVDESPQPDDILIDLSDNQAMLFGVNSAEVLSRPATSSNICKILSRTGKEI